MHIFNKETISVNKKFFQMMPEAYFPGKTLFFSVNDAFSLAASDHNIFTIGIGFGIAGEKGELRNSLKLLSCLIFVYLYKLDMHFLHFSQTFP